MRAFLAALVVLGAVLAVVASVPAQAPIQLKAGTAAGGDSPHNEAFYEVAKLLDQKSKGRIKMEVVIGNALAKGEAAHLEGAQIGSIDVVGIGSAPIGGMFEPLYQGLDTPLFWTTRGQIWEVLGGPIRHELLHKIEDKRGHGFCLAGSWGVRH